MITVNKANPTAAEERTSLVNASDGAGLHFDGAAGNVSGTSNLALGSKYSAEFVLSYAGSANNRLFDINGDTRFIVEFNRTGFTGKIAGYDSDFYEICDIPDDGVFHLVVTVDGTAVSAYVNGNLAGTATKNNSTSIDTVTQWTIGANDGGSFGHFEGTIYRARFYNRTLSADDVRTAYERADVDYSSQYGSQTSLVDAGASVFTSGTYSWSAYGSNTIANVGNALEITYVNHAYGASNGLRDSSDLTTDLTVGKKYRLTVDAKYTGGSAGSKLQLSLAGSNTDFATLTTSLVTYTYEFTTDTAAGGGLRMSGMSAGNVVTIDNWYLREIGCVSDYDLAFANENQSRMVADRSTNNVDGEMSSSGVKQTQVIKQLNSTAMRVGGTSATPLTPADGDIVADKIGVGVAPSTLADFKANSTNGATIKLINSDYNNTNEFTAGIGNLDIFANTTTVLGAAYRYLRLGVGTTEAMRIDSSANVTVSGPKLEVTDDLASAHTILKLKNTNAAAGYGSQIQLEDHDSKYYISIVDSDLKFFNGATTTVNFANSGLATFSGGIAFPAPTPASAGTPAASSVLDVYEEGTFLPNVGGNATYTSREGRYTRVGRLVTCTFDMTISAIGTGSTNIVSGLPFATGDSIGAGGNVNYYSGLALSPVLFAPTVSGSGVQIRSATSAATSPSNHAILGDGSRVACVATYTV